MSRSLRYTILLILAASLFYMGFSGRDVHAGQLIVRFFDVGQGDSALIRTPSGRTVLVDGGPGQAVLDRLGEALPWSKRRIDLVVLTHPHDDHAAGLVGVAERYEIGRVLAAGVTHTAPTYLAFLEAVRDRNIPLTLADRPQTISLGDDCRLEVLYPLMSFAGQAVTNLNNTSIVSRLVCGRTRVLLMGDAEATVEKTLLDSGVDLAADVLKVAHHGSDTGTTDAFLDKVGPALAVISVSAKNTFGHPSRRIIKRLRDRSITTAETDTSGTITLVGDGENLIWEETGETIARNDQ